MNWIKKTLLLALCLPVLFACGGSGDDDIDDDVNAKHHYRVEVEISGDTPSYHIQVVFNCLKKYVPGDQPNVYVDFTVDGEKADAWWKPSSQLYNFSQAIRPYETEAHNFVFAPKHVFETVEKGVQFGLGVSVEDLTVADDIVPGPITTRIRVYQDDKLIDEAENNVGGNQAEYKYGPKVFQ